MPKIATEMTAIEVKRLEHPGGPNNATFNVGGVTGLQLQITPSGAKSWLLRTTVGQRRRKLGLGSYPTVGLAAARERAREARVKVEAGIDPVEEKRAARAALAAQQARSLTFSEAMERYAPKKLAELKSEKQRRLWRSSLETHALPVLGKLPVDQIKRSDVLRVLEPIWSTKTETATKLRGRIEAILTWAEVAGHCEGPNAARWAANLDQFLARPSKIKAEQHYPALSLADAPRWWSDLSGRTGMATDALRFVAMTAARSGEVRGATWSEIDVASAIWTIPADRMKMGRLHRVPLCESAVDLLQSLPRHADNDLIFWAARGGKLSDMSLSATMRRMQAAAEKHGEKGFLDPVSSRPATVHGLRSTFRQWTAEHGFDRDMAEMQLAHAVGSDVERAYQRSDFLERRRAMMADWVSFLAGADRGLVVPLRGALA